MPELVVRKNIYRYRKKRKINIKRLLLLILFLCIIAMMPILTSSLFAVKNIQVTGNKNISAGEIIKAVNFFYDKNLLMIKDREVKKAVSESVPVKEVHVGYKLPNTLIITVREREVAAALPYLSSFVLIDSDGVVVKIIPKLNSITVPVVTGFDITHATVAGKPTIRNNDASFKKFLELLSVVSPLSSELSEIHIGTEDVDDPVFYLYTLDGYQIYLGNFETSKIQVMKQILDDLRKNGRGKGEINISGETPVFKPFPEDRGEDKP